MFHPISKIIIFMKKYQHLTLFPVVVVAALIAVSCASPVTLTSWKNPADNSQVTKVVVFPLFDKLEYTKPFEQAMAAYFESKGLKALGALDFLNPTIKYPMPDVIKKIDSMGANGVLVFKYTGTDKSQNYVPATYYGGWGGGYWGGGYWGGGYWGGGVATGGYWVTTSTLNLKASLYVKANKEAVWTGDITVTDPNYVDQAATTIAQDIYADWVKNNVVNTQVTVK
jgi:hypothetical protein